MAENDVLAEAGGGEGVKLKDLIERRSDVNWLDLDSTEIMPGWNVREINQAYEDRILWLMGSIEARGGIENPVRGFFDKQIGKLKITRGHKRHEAVRRLREQGKVFLLPTLLEKTSDPAELVAVQVRDNDGGQPLTTFERAELFKRLNVLGWSTQRIADENPTPITRQQVENMIALADVTPLIKQMVTEGTISATTAAQEMKAAKAASPDDLAAAAFAAQHILLTTVDLAKEQGTKPTAENARIVRESQAPIESEPAPSESLFAGDEAAKEAQPEAAPAAVHAVQGSGMDKASTAPQPDAKTAKPAKEKAKPKLKKGAGKDGKSAEKGKGYDGHSPETVEQALALLTVMRQIMPDCNVEDLAPGSDNNKDSVFEKVVITMRKSDYTQMMGFIE